MPRKSTKGTRLLGAEIEESLFEALKGYAHQRRETLREVIELAIRRHLANPPPLPELPPLPPFPPVAAGEPVAKRKGGKK